MSQPEILLDAIVASQDRLGDLLADAKPSFGSDGIFLRRPNKTHPAEPMSTLSIRILTANLAVIDQLVADHASPSRSALCVAALQDFLK